MAKTHKYYCLEPVKNARFVNSIVRISAPAIVSVTTSVYEIEIIAFNGQ